MRGQSEGTRPMAKERKATQRQGGTVGGQGQAHLHSGRGVIRGELQWGLVTPPPGSSDTVPPPRHTP